MVEKWFVILFVVSHLINLGISIDKHGEPREGEYSAGAAIIATTISFTLAWLGGLFECFS